MRLRILLVVALMAAMFACSKKEDSVLPGNPSGSDSEYVVIKVPEAADLLQPAADKLYTEGEVKTDSTSEVIFKWEKAENAKSYKLVVQNLLDQTELSDTTSDTAMGIVVRQNTPYRWFVVSLSADSAKKKKSETIWFYNSGKGVSNYAPLPADSLSPRMGKAFYPFEVKEITFSWHGADVDDEDLSYDFYFGTDSMNLKKIGAGLDENNYSNVEVRPDSTYYWRVVTLDQAGNSTGTQIYHFKIHPVADPHNLSVDSLYPENGRIFPSKDTANIGLAWKGIDELGDISSYDVYFGTDSAELQKMATEVTDEQYSDITVHSNTTYYWKIVAFDKTGQSFSTDIVHFRVRRIIPPHTLYPAASLVPENGKEIEAKDSPVTLSWKGQDEQHDITTYDVYFGTDPTALSPLGIGLTEEEYPDVSVDPGTTYYWKVVSHDKAGASSVTSIYSFSVGTVVSTTPLYWDVADNPEVTSQSYYGVENHDYSKDDLPGYINDEVANYFPTYTFSEGANFVNNDYLAIPLGERRSEWIEFTTPEIKAGKYNVWICYRSAGKDKQITITVDGETLITDFNFHEYMPKMGENGINTEEDLEAAGWKFYTSPDVRNFAGRLAGKVVFGQDGTHKIRFTVDLDNSDTGEMNWLDMIQFIPVQMDQLYPKFDTNGNPVNKP